MSRAMRLQIPLMAGLILFTFINLIPIIWGFMISIRQPGDAFSIPPKLIFDPTLIFHYQVWFERGFLSFLGNSLIIAAGTIGISVPIGTMAAYGLARMKSKHSGKLLFGLLAVRMFPQILLAIPFFVMARGLGMIDSYWMMILSMVAIAEYGGEDIAYWSLSAAGAIGIMLPVVLFTIAVQKHLIRGLTFGAVKG